jgi:hypothetical protein
MNVFANFANNITNEVNKIEENINDTIDNVKGDINITVDNVSRDLNLNSEEEYQAVLADLRNGVPLRGIEPEDIKDMTDEQALKFIRSRSINYDELPEVPLEETTQEETQEMLEDPQIASIVNDLRSEFPEPTSTPAPLNTVRLITREPTISVNIEGFENIPLPTAVRVNNHLKQQFVENFKF